MIQFLRRPRLSIYNRHVLRRDLRYCVVEGVLYSLMLGLAETWFGAFYIAAEIDTFSIGILATVPLLVGSLIQLLTPWGIRQAGSYRVWSVIVSSLQGFSLIGLSLLCGFGLTQFWLIFLLMVVYRATGLAMVPAWNTWMEFIIPKGLRTRYLSCRMRICQTFLLSAVVIAGFLLHFFADINGLILFNGLFLTAGLLRISSAWLLGRHTEQPHWINENSLTIVDHQRGGDSRAIEKVIPFFVVMQFSVFVSGPFFTPFMLRSMNIDYSSFMFLIVLGYLGRVLTLELAGEVARRWGVGRLLWLGSLGLIPLSGLWWFFESFWFLAIVQLVGGIAWGFYELAMSLVLMEQIPRAKRPQVLSVFGVLNAFAMVAGSLLGGLVLQQMNYQVAGFMTVFWLSTILRAASILMFPFGLINISKPQAAVTVPEAIIPAAPHLNGRPAMGALVNLAATADQPEAALKVRKK